LVSTISGIVSGVFSDGLKSPFSNQVLVAAAADATQWPAALALLDAMGRRCEACEDAMGRAN